MYAPCALGATINDTTIPRLKATIIAGCANNQLAESRHGEILREKGILYAPDYVINAGGIINVYYETAPEGYSKEASNKHVVIYREERRGWYVSPERICYNPLSRSHFHQMIREQHRIAETKLLNVRSQRIAL